MGNNEYYLVDANVLFDPGATPPLGAGEGSVGNNSLLNTQPA